MDMARPPRSLDSAVSGIEGGLLYRQKTPTQSPMDPEVGDGRGYTRNPLLGHNAEAPPAPTLLAIVEMAFPITPVDLAHRGRMAWYVFYRKRPFP